MLIRGSIVALITPMDAEGAVDEKALGRLIDLHVESGTAAIVAVGTTGESATLDESEHCDVIGHCVELAAGRLPIIAGTGANSTTEAIRLTRCAERAGADAALLVTPYYNKPTQDGLVAHYSAIADAVGLPQILYNVPGRTACDMLPETTARLAEQANIVGLKDATGDLARLPRLRELCGSDFALYSGDDATGCEFMLRGGDGVISVTNNVAPALMRRMCDAALGGRREDAEALNDQLDGLHHALFLESNPIPVKWALAEMGLVPAGIRLPLTQFSATHHDALRAAMSRAGVL
jgi:4-hydroxy-tetrahydrodipicolinate synthase